MQSQTLRNLAILMIVLAVGLGMYALHLGRELSHPKDVATTDADAPKLERVVIALHAIEAGHEIAAEAVSLEQVAVVPEGAFLELERVLGRKLQQGLAPGEPIMRKHFRPIGPITQRLEPEERAMAVKVDGVIGLGGFIQPGDRVDVLLYLARDQQEIAHTEARVLLENARVLAYGNQVEASGGSGAEPTKDARTAVLAVPSDKASRLLLGAAKGRLRLALRGGDTDALAEQRIASTEVATLEALVGVPKKAKATPKAGFAVRRGRTQEITRY